MKTYIYFLVATLVILSSCLKDKAVEPIENTVQDTCADTISFSSEIMPLILNPSCNTASCHNATDAAAGIDLTTYSNVAPISDILLKTMQHESGVSAMPKNLPILHDSIVAKFECWINQGKLNN